MNDVNYGNYSTSLLSKYLVYLLSGNISYLCSEEIFQCLQVRLNTKFRPPVVWSKIFRNFGRAELAIKVKPKNSVVKVKPATPRFCLMAYFKLYFETLDVVESEGNKKKRFEEDHSSCSTLCFSLRLSLRLSSCLLCVFLTWENYHLLI